MAMAQRENRALLIDPRVAGSSPAGQLWNFSSKVNFHNVFKFSQKLCVDISFQFHGPASKLSCADRVVASADFVPLL